MTTRQERLRSDSTELELDGYEAPGSADSLDGYDDEDDDLKEEMLSSINITESFSSRSFYPDVPLLDDFLEDPFKNTELVLKFSPTIKPEALKWFIRKMTLKKSQGGAQLLLRRESGRVVEHGLVVHITAACWRQLEVAEMLDIKKVDYTLEDKSPREFKMNEMFRFMDHGKEPDDILSSSEKQIVVFHELRHLHSLPGETYVPGYKNMKLTTGTSLFHLFVKKQLITSYFPLHEEVELNKMAGKWYKEFFDEHPYEAIRNYFGDSTCLYFNFVAYLSLWLLIPCCIDLLMLCLSYIIREDVYQRLLILNCFWNMLFVTAFLICWQRYQSTITHKWGTLQLNAFEEPRPHYYGKLGIDPVTGHMHRKYPYKKTCLKTFIDSFFVVPALSAAAVWGMYIYLELEADAKAYSKKVRQSYPMTKRNSFGYLFWKEGFPLVPSLVYALAVLGSTVLYRIFSRFLTEFENHRTETQFERHLVYKMVTFEVANGFSILLYSAIMEDIGVLRRRLFMLLGVVQICIMVNRCLLPYLYHKGQAKMRELLDHNRIRRMLGIGRTSDHRELPRSDLDPEMDVMNDSDVRVQMSKVEGDMDPYDYEADFDDYLDLYLQFGYIFLFPSALPLAALIALLCNIFLLKISLYKRCEVYQRPLARRVASIGAWQQAFELLSVITVVTNCAVLSTNKHMRAFFPDYSDELWVIFWLVVEHFLLAVQYVVKHLFSKVPYKVKVALAAVDYRSRQALKREQATNMRKRITRVFQPINPKFAGKQRGQNNKMQTTQPPPTQVRQRERQSQPDNPPPQGNQVEQQRSSLPRDGQQPPQSRPKQT